MLAPKLTELTEVDIRKFAGTTIFNRGYDYFEQEMIYELNYDANRIVAEVYGNYGDYEVEIISEEGEVEASCSCPYDGYPCKHVVAALLTFIHDKETYTRQATRRQSEISSLKDKIRKLSRDNLIEIVISCLDNYPDFWRDMAVRLASDKELTLNTILKQVKKAFPNIESYDYSEAAIAKQLRAILKSVKNSSADVRLKVHWAIVDRTLKELNDYGMSDVSLESLAIDTMELLAKSLDGGDQSRQERQTIIGELLDYYVYGNCGIVDAIYETAESICVEESDYRIVIRKLKEEALRGTFQLYHKSKLANLYAQIGDSDSRLAVLERGLEYGTDYWLLASYWLERDEKEKALKVIEEGLDKTAGGKTELYEYMENHLQTRGDMDGIFQLLERKMEDLYQGGRGNVEDDSAYQYLLVHYDTAGDYHAKVNLLNLRFSHGEAGLSLYKAAASILAPTDLPKFQKQIIERLKKSIQENQPAGPWLARNAKPEIQTLAEIYAYEDDRDNLLEVISKDIDLLARYESKLLRHSPDTYLEQYANEVNRLIEKRGRDNYRTAVRYLKKIKNIHETVLDTPHEWEKYVENLRENNKTLRAFQDELKRL